jgi:hypothetical protein
LLTLPATSNATSLLQGSMEVCHTSGIGSLLVFPMLLKCYLNMRIAVQECNVLPHHHSLEEIPPRTWQTDLEQHHHQWHCTHLKVTCILYPATPSSVYKSNSCYTKLVLLIMMCFSHLESLLMPLIQAL